MKIPQIIIMYGQGIHSLVYDETSETGFRTECDKPDCDICAGKLFCVICNAETTKFNKKIICEIDEDHNEMCIKCSKSDDILCVYCNKQCCVRCTYDDRNGRYLRLEKIKHVCKMKKGCKCEYRYCSNCITCCRKCSCTLIKSSRSKCKECRNK